MIKQGILKLYHYTDIEYCLAVVLGKRINNDLLPVPSIDDAFARGNIK